MLRIPIRRSRRKRIAAEQQVDHFCHRETDEVGRGDPSECLWIASALRTC
jgi:hypothetical protein